MTPARKEAWFRLGFPTTLITLCCVGISCSKREPTPNAKPQSTSHSTHDPRLSEQVKIAIDEGNTSALVPFQDKLRTLAVNRVGVDIPALNYACRVGSVETVQLLLASGCDPRAIDNDDLNPLGQSLNRSASSLSHEIVSSLLNSGASATSPVYMTGAMPLSIAAMKDDGEASQSIVKLLLSHGADPLNGGQANGSNSPIEIAIAYSNPRILELMLRHLSSVGQTTKLPENTVALAEEVVDKRTTNGRNSLKDDKRKAEAQALLQRANEVVAMLREYRR